MRKILIIYDYFYPAFKAGGPIQSLINITKHLGKDNTLFILCTDKDLDGTTLEVKTDEWIWVEELNINVFYMSNKGVFFLKIFQLIRQLNPSVIFINGIYSLSLSFMPALYPISARKIISVRGMLHPGALEIKKTKKKIYLFIYKLLGINRKCEFHATNTEEKGYIERNFVVYKKIWVVPNLPNKFLGTTTLLKNSGQLNLVSIALIGPMKNHDLVIKALKYVKNGSITYEIYGPIKDKVYWDKCKLLIDELPENVSVNYKGAISPDNLSLALDNAHFSILPSVSENYGHSIVESLLYGKPVITSKTTPWNELELFKAGYNIGTIDELELVNILNSVVLMDNIEYQKWVINAKEYIESRLNTKKTKEQYLEMFCV